MPVRFVSGIVAVALFTGLAVADNGALPVSRMRDWSIVVAPDAMASERYAAEEFRRFFAAATGIDLPISAQPKRGGCVFIGPSEALRQSRIGFDTRGYGEEEFRIRVGRRGIAIAGGRPRGTLYGVYQFLEDGLGVRFLTATHTHVPHDPERRLPRVDARRAPGFVYRWSYCKEASAHPEFAARLRLNTLTPEDRFGGVTRETMESHTVHYQVPVARYGKEHPEYFAWVDGERMLEAPGGGPQVCPMNPDVVEVVTRAVLDELRRKPDAANASVSINDNPFYCRCPTCEAVNDREGSPAAAHLTLVNAVAERVERARPGTTIATLAYSYTRRAPLRLRPRANVRVWFCAFEACGLHRLDDPACPRNRAVMADFEGWRAICPDVRFWYYNTNLRTLDLPYPNLRSLGPNLRLLRDKGVGGVFMQANERCFAGEFADLRNYVTSRLLWNPGLDAETLCEEFMALHYGRAAGPIGAAIEIVHDAAERSGAHPYCWIDPSGAGIGRETAPQLLGLFERALELAPDETIRGRVEKASLGAYKALFETQGRLVYDAGRVRLDYPPGVLDLVPHYRELCERHGMTFDSEFRSREDFLESLRNMVAGTPAVRLEDETWRLTLLPAFHGEIVELVHKPTEWPLLDAWDRPGIDIPRGTWDEWGSKGLESAPQAFDYTGDSRSTRLVKRLDDGTTLTREVRLRRGRIAFETSIRHGAEAGRMYAWSAGGDLAAVADDARNGELTMRNPSGGSRIRLAYELGQYGPAEVEADRRLRVELSSPPFRLERGGLWRARYSIGPISGAR